MRKLLVALALCGTAAEAQQIGNNVAGAVAGSSLNVGSPGYLQGVNVTSGASAGYVLVFDSTTVPADGAVTPARCVPLAANTGIELNWRASPIMFRNGMVVVFSTTGCFTKTASATAFIAADYR